ncbi:hypothetical protein [Bacillus thermotolerans]|uniref:Uncharacterized protein n=1 Tax=Bacillus thermotolerans TaxID=1221996 RepID=A0A0F5HUL9_BACTR|nr:hypothetical protein [Bacillus thermotolerans]KKB33854.1 hypothetical protein QY97_02935 [Bacillus thermotolerans]KKB36745.1 hypothetical protein QY95_03013 [Bacillus thermotolerans]KKB44776.1 hypothetical protein QY96_01057 [Bacillus thermotolerans]
MQPYPLIPNARLLIHHSEEKEKLFYSPVSSPFWIPKIGPRPPYYAYPRYDPHYPVI